MSFEDKAGLIELIIFYSIAIGFCVWQLVSVRRLMRRDKEAANTIPTENRSAVAPDRPSQPTAQHQGTNPDPQPIPVTQD